MDPKRFDMVTRIFADRRASRRSALRAGAAGLVSTGLVAAGLSNTAQAQEASPEPAAGSAGKGKTLFVQTFQHGTIDPKAGEAGTWTLTLEEGLGQTIYFSDRPERSVGITPTEQFIQAIGFPGDNPPNAALVFETESGDVDITVVELFNPTYDVSTHTAIFDIQLLKEYAQLGVTLQEQPTEPPDAHAAFGAAHLFIDDCPDATMSCVSNECYPFETPLGGPYCEVIGTIDNGEHDGFCYSGLGVACLPCTPWFEYRSDALAHWSEECDARFPECNGNCRVYSVCTYGVPSC
jgi:hypothetical protein